MIIEQVNNAFLEGVVKSQSFPSQNSTGFSQYVDPNTNIEVSRSGVLRPFSFPANWGDVMDRDKMRRVFVLGGVVRVYLVNIVRAMADFGEFFPIDLKAGESVSFPPRYAVGYLTMSGKNSTVIESASWPITGHSPLNYLEIGEDAIKWPIANGGQPRVADTPSRAMWLTLGDLFAAQGPAESSQWEEDYEDEEEEAAEEEVNEVSLMDQSGEEVVVFKNQPAASGIIVKNQEGE